MSLKLITGLYNWIYLYIHPALPSLAETKSQEIAKAQRSLHELELHHLHTLQALEHYGAVRAELEARIERLSKSST